MSQSQQDNAPSTNSSYPLDPVPENTDTANDRYEYQPANSSYYEPSFDSKRSEEDLVAEVTMFVAELSRLLGHNFGGAGPSRDNDGGDSDGGCSDAGAEDTAQHEGESNNGYYCICTPSVDSSDENADASGEDADASAGDLLEHGQGGVNGPSSAEGASPTAGHTPSTVVHQRRPRPRCSPSSCFDGNHSPRCTNPSSDAIVGHRNGIGPIVDDAHQDAGMSAMDEDVDDVHQNAGTVPLDEETDADYVSQNAGNSTVDGGIHSPSDSDMADYGFDPRVNGVNEEANPLTPPSSSSDGDRTSGSGVDAEPRSPPHPPSTSAGDAGWAEDIHSDFSPVQETFSPSFQSIPDASTTSNQVPIEPFPRSLTEITRDDLIRADAIFRVQPSRVPPNTRILFSTSWENPMSQFSSSLGVNDDSIVLLHTQSGDVLAVKESSGTADLNLRFGESSVTLFFTPWSDEVSIQNLTGEMVCFAPQGYRGRPRALGHEADAMLVPGDWKIWRGLNQCVTLRVLERQHLTAKSEAAGSGSKRQSQESGGRPAKRHHSGRKTGKGSDQNRASTGLGGAVTGQRTREHRDDDIKMLNVRDELFIAPKALRGLEPKERLSERYSVTYRRRICEQVFEGDHSVLGVVAVKVVRIGTKSRVPLMAKEWKNEVQILRKLNHDAIVKIKGSDARLLTIYMEHHDFPDPAGYRHPETNFFTGGEPQAEQVLKDVASALEYMHGLGLFHFDIKPGNILFNGRNAILVDFGFAGPNGRDEVWGAGSPWYLPPEFLAKLGQGGQRDIYAVGVVGLFLLKWIPLPDVTREMWVPGLVTKEKDAAEAMARWLTEVDECREQLANTGLDEIPHDILEPNPEHRLTARALRIRLGRLRK